MPGAPEAKPTDLEVGELLNNTYRLDQLIGQGGMGRVFSATDLKLERKVAVKVLSVANLDTETVRRFDRETQVMGQLDHPSVVTLFSFGRTRGVPWLAMRLLEGMDLWATLASHGGRMTPAQLLPIVRQILAALGYLHGRGLLHRDLKPSNIHIGKTGKVTLCDFGLARGHKSTLTRTGVIWGTPEYMAPEQILGERELDGRADLYSLAVVMYRMLAGQPLFADVNDTDVLRAHLNRPRPDLSRVQPTLSSMVGAAMQKGLAIHPEDRFQSAEEMLAAMELVLQMPLVSARIDRGAVTVASPGAVPRAAGTRVGVVPRATDAVETTPAAPALVPPPDTDENEPATRPHGFNALMDEPEGDTTSREGFSAFTPPPEARRITRDEEEAAPEDRTVPARSAVKPPGNSESLPVHTVSGTPTPTVDPRPGPPLPLPLLIGGALMLFLLGLAVSKLLL